MHPCQEGKSGPTGQRHLQGVPVTGAPEDTYLRPQDTYPHHRIPTPPLSGGIRGTRLKRPSCTVPATSFIDLPSGGVGRQGPFFGVFAGRPRFPQIFWTIAGAAPRVCIRERVCSWVGTSINSY